MCPWAAAARSIPNASAFICPDGQILTWADIDVLIERARKVLVDLLPGSIALVVTNRLEDLAIIVAAMREGRDVVLFGPRSPRSQVENEASRLHARILDGAVLDGKPEGDSSGTGDQPRLSGHTLVQTSGSTGHARWIRHGAEEHLNSARGAIERLGLNEEARWGWCLPAHHVGGLSVLWRCALVGAAVVCPPPGISVPDWIESLGPASMPTHLSVVPTQLSDLLSSFSSPPDELSSVIVGGAAASTALMSKAIAAGWPIRTTYGMTETASMVTLSEVWTDAPTGPVHVGQPLPGAALEIRKGRLFVRTKALGEDLEDDDGWFPTSDQANVDTEGRWTIVGRLDRVIISGGENLNPDRIERAIRSVPGVEAALVVAIPDERYGQRPVAFVRTDPAGPVSPDFREALGKTLASFEIPDAFYELPPLSPGQTKWSRESLEELAGSAKYVTRAESTAADKSSDDEESTNNA